MNLIKLLWLVVLLLDVLTVVVLVYQAVNYILTNLTSKFTSHIYVKDTIDLKLNRKIILQNILMIVIVLLSGSKNFINYYEGASLGLESMVFFVCSKTLFVVYLFLNKNIIDSIKPKL